MPNSYFKFKEFQINQDKTAMKVGTDGVLLGSLAKNTDNQNILDIGTGTGLISIMMAQRYPKCKIIGIEPETNAFNQSIENCKNSKWNKNITIINSDLQNFKIDNKFSCIVSNPPFYRDSLKSKQKSRAKARQADSLPIIDILKFAKHHLTQNGELWIIYPSMDYNYIEEISKSIGLFINTCIFIKPNILKSSHRVILQIMKVKSKNTKIEIFPIEILKRHDYSDRYREIGKDFYLKF